MTKFIYWLRHSEKSCSDLEADCSTCNIKSYCLYEPWFIKIYYFIHVHVCNMAERIKSIIQNILKIKYVCSNCGLVTVPNGKYAAIKDSYGWRKRNGLWTCHHCDAHKNDCVKADKDGNFVEISQEEFDKNWKEYVISNNQKYGL